MGEVYRARDSKLSRDVSIKVLPGDLARDAAALTRFEREAKAVAALSHPNILAIHDFGTHQDTTYAVMELLEGESLQQRLTEGPLPQRKTLEVARDIAMGLAAAHEKGIVHRDLKPANLFLTQDGRVKILDFGLARQITLPSADDTNSPTVGQASEPGFIVGTVGYMAPEQLKGQPADARSDIFSFGAVLYEMLLGKRAFRGDSAIATMNAILKEDPPSLSESGRHIPPTVERIVAHCLEKNPAERFQSARDLAFDLGVASEASGRAIDLGPTSSRKVSLRMLSRIAAFIATFAIGVIGGRWLLTRKTTSEVPSFHRLTLRRGRILGAAAFAADGRTVAYSASWEGAPSEIFTVRTESTESRAVGLSHATLLAVSAKGELAVLLTKPGAIGTLARIPMGGGTPRELLEDAVDADWGPNGEELAVIRILPSGARRLEYPIGNAISENVAFFNSIRVSPRGDRIACVDYGSDGRATVVAIDRKGGKTQLSSGWRDVFGLAWTPRGDAVVFVSERSAGDRAIREVPLTGGPSRVLLSNAADLSLYDVGPDGRFLVARVVHRYGMRSQARGATSEREIGWLDRSVVAGLSDDGSSILFAESGESADSKGGAFLRKADGSAAVRLGDGQPLDLSADGRWALSLSAGPPTELVMLPIGPGLPRKIRVDGVTPFGGNLLPRGRGLMVNSIIDGKPQNFVVGPDGGAAKSLPLECDTWDRYSATSPEGDRLACVAPDGRLVISPLPDGAATIVPGIHLERLESPCEWSADGRFLYILGDGVPAPVDRLELSTGQRKPWKKLAPEDSAEVTLIHNVAIAPDGQSYAYSYDATVTSALYVLEGLR
jgi:eukaryotic-like serine/threonine-protein kinase